MTLLLAFALIAVASAFPPQFIGVRTLPLIIPPEIMQVINSQLTKDIRAVEVVGMPDVAETHAEDLTAVKFVDDVDNSAPNTDVKAVEIADLIAKVSKTFQDAAKNVVEAVKAPLANEMDRVNIAGSPVEGQADVDTPTPVRIVDAPVEGSDVPAPTPVKIIDAPLEKRDVPAPTPVKIVDAPQDENDVPAPTLVKIVNAPTEENDVPAPTPVKIVDAPLEVNDVPAPTSVNIVDTPVCNEETKVESPKDFESVLVQKPVIVDQKMPGKKFDNPMWRAV